MADAYFANRAAWWGPGGAFYQGPRGPQWEAFYMLFAHEARTPYDTFNLPTGPLPLLEDLLAIMDAMLAAIKRGVPFPLGPLCDWLKLWPMPGFTGAQLGPGQ